MQLDHTLGQQAQCPVLMRCGNGAAGQRDQVRLRFAIQAARSMPRRFAFQGSVEPRQHETLAHFDYGVGVYLVGVGDLFVSPVCARIARIGFQQDVCMRELPCPDIAGLGQAY